jgi:hypothetical protein
MKISRYVNMNSFPVYLPDGHGGQTMFRSGEGTTLQWFSRFLSMNQLTHITYVPSKQKEAVEQKIIKDDSVNIKNIDQIASAIAKLLEGRLNIINQSSVNKNEKEGFDNSSSQTRLADAMFTQIQEKDSNFKEVDQVSIKKKKKETDVTLTLLQELE